MLVTDQVEDFFVRDVDLPGGAKQIMDDETNQHHQDGSLFVPRGLHPRSSAPHKFRRLFEDADRVLDVHTRRCALLLKYARLPRSRS